ncbi:MAG: hypothetical protein WA581_04565 [Candidatus Acidiferrales bacterium]
MEQVQIAGKITEAGPTPIAEWSERAPGQVETWAEKRFSPAHFLLDLAKNSWAWFHLLSLDAPLVGVLWQLLFAKALRVRLAPVVTLITALVIWLIYVGDRILDSYQSEEASEEALRHRFYRARRMDFLPAFFTILLVTAWMAHADLGLRTWRDGWVLAAIVGGYFAVVHMSGGRTQKWFPKEIAVAILFGVGTFMPVGVGVQQLHVRFLLPLLLFFLVLWMNTLLIEYSEWITLRGRDADRPHESTILVGRHLASFGVGIAVLAFGAIATRWFPLARTILLAEGLSALGLSVLGWKWRRISSYAVRVTADVVLLTPLLLFLLRR